MNPSEFISWLSQRAEHIRTPAYIYSESSLDASFNDLRVLFPADVRLFYSLKANPQPAIVRYMLSLGAGSEIASAGERFMCSIAGVPNGDILVGGVSKSAQYLDGACDQNPAAIVIESLREWSRLREVLSARRRAQVLLRVNPGISTGGLDMAGDSQFGLSVDQALLIAKECRRNPDTEFLGLHFYFGSQRLTGEPIVKLVQAAGEVVEAFGDDDVQVGVVDLGLGCGVPYLEKDQKLDMVKLKDELRLQWNRSTWTTVRLWTEAGRSLVGGSGYYVTRVLERKERQGKKFIFLDGGLNVHNPGIGVGRFFRSNPRFLAVGTGGSVGGDGSEVVDIVGNLCTSADCLGRNVTMPILDEGDLIIIPNSGAYCQTTALWGFNSQALFAEGMLSRDGRLEYVEPQHRILLNNGK